MIQEGKFGLHETVCLLVITSAAKVFFTSPGAVFNIVGTAGWYMTLISTITAIIGFTFIYLLLKRFPGKNIVDAYNASLGKVFGFIFSFVLSAALLLISAINAREFAEVLKIYAFPLSPPSYILGLFLIVVLTFSFMGLESIARYAKLMAYIMLLGFSTVLILSYTNYSLYNLFPIWGYGIGNTVKHGILRSSAYSEIIILAVIATSVQGIKYVKKAGYISLVLQGLIVSVGLLAANAAFPYYTGRELTAPFYVMALMIDLGRFFRRLEPIFLFIWGISSLISVTALFYSALMVYCQIFEINDKRPFIFPLSIILFTITMIPPSVTSVTEQYVNISRMYGWMVFFLMPFIALIIAVVRKKKGAVKGA